MMVYLPKRQQQVAFFRSVLLVATMRVGARKVMGIYNNEGRHLTQSWILSLGDCLDGVLGCDRKKLHLSGELGKFGEALAENATKSGCSRDRRHKLQ